MRTYRHSQNKFDFLLLISTISLLLIGILFIYSSGVSSTGIVFSKEYIRQIVWSITGILLLISLSFTDYRRIQFFSPYIYFFFIGLLVFTYFFGKEVNGARSWLGILDFGVQPSEFTKIASILLLSSYYSNHRDGAKEVFQFLIGFGIVLLPLLLIFIQPDVGTALVYIPIFLFISFIAHARVQYLLFVILTGIFFSLLTVFPFWNQLVLEKELLVLSILTDRKILQYAAITLLGIGGLAFIGYLFFKKKYYYWIVFFSAIFLIAIGTSLVARMVVKDYQIMRMVVFLDPTVDPQGAGWHIIQSVTAVGSGGLAGKGFLHGTQSHYQFLPQQSTDFIFSIIAEEWGFLGGVLIFFLYGIIFTRGILIIVNTDDAFARYTATGVVGMLFFHFFVNIGMAMGIMPITGIPLFFLSYGGSSLWTATIGIGVLISINKRRYRG